MKIVSGHISIFLNSYRKQGQIEEKAKENLNKTDQTELSREAKLYQTSLKTLKSLPEVREDKVAELKKAIDSGTYQISGQDIVEKMIEGNLVDQLV